MKEFKIKMTKELANSALKHIKTKNNIISLLLESIPVLRFGEKAEKETNNIMILRIDKMKRLFFVFNEKIFSFNFPFNVETSDNGENPIIYDSITNLKIQGKSYSALKTAFEEIIYEKEKKGILDIDSELF